MRTAQAKHRKSLKQPEENIGEAEERHKTMKRKT
jgi:hypothetical protein